MPRPRFLRAGVLVFDAQGTETLLRPRRTALYHFPLLAPPATAGYGACAKPFNVYSHEKKNEKLDYMHANPVTRGLVMEQWVIYSKKEPGLVPIDAVNL